MNPIHQPHNAEPHARRALEKCIATLEEFLAQHGDGSSLSDDITLITRFMRSHPVMTAKPRAVSGAIPIHPWAARCQALMPPERTFADEMLSPIAQEIVASLLEDDEDDAASERDLEAGEGSHSER